VENFTASSVFQGKVEKISIQYIQPVKAITVKFLVWRTQHARNFTPLSEQASKVTTEFADHGTSRVLYSIKNVIAELKL